MEGEQMHFKRQNGQLTKWEIEIDAKKGFSHFDLLAKVVTVGKWEKQAICSTFHFAIYFEK